MSLGDILSVVTNKDAIEALKKLGRLEEVR